MAPSSLQVERLVQAAQPKVFSRMGFITQSVPRGSAPPAVGALGSRKGEHERVCDQGPVSGPNKKMKGLTREEKFEHVSAEIIARGGLRRTLMFNGEGETVVARDEVFLSESGRRRASCTGSQASGAAAASGEGSRQASGSAAASSMGTTSCPVASR